MGGAGFTTVSVSKKTLARLGEYRRGHQSLDNVLNEFMDEIPSVEFLAEMERRAREPNLPWTEVKERLSIRKR